MSCEENCMCDVGDDGVCEKGDDCCRAKKVSEEVEESEEHSVCKDFLVSYVGDKLQPEDGKVNLSMIVSVLIREFPDLIMSLAYDSWTKGYEQAMADLQTTEEDLQNAIKVDEDELDEVAGA